MVLRRLKRALCDCLALVEDARDPRSIGHREALRHVATVLRNLEAR